MKNCIEKSFVPAILLDKNKKKQKSTYSFYEQNDKNYLFDMRIQIYLSLMVHTLRDQSLGIEAYFFSNKQHNH